MKTNSRDTAERLAFLQLSQHDTDLLKTLHGLLKGGYAPFIDKFYEHLQHFDEPKQLLSDPVVLEQLKYNQEVYFENLIKGCYDLNYVKDRARIGETHHSIGFKPHWHMGVYQYYLAWLLPEIQQHLADDPSVCIDTIQAVIKVILFDIALMVDAYFYADYEMLRLLSQVFQNNIEGVIITNVRRQILHVNNKVATIAGYQTEDLIGQPITLLLPRRLSENSSKPPSEFFCPLHLQHSPIASSTNSHQNTK